LLTTAVVATKGAVAFDDAVAGDGGVEIGRHDVRNRPRGERGTRSTRHLFI